MNWYIVQAYSGFEKKVVESIKDELKRHKLGKNLIKYLFPLIRQQKLKRQKNQKRKKIFSWICASKSRTNQADLPSNKKFTKVALLGSANKPTPISDNEIKQILGQVSRVHNQKSGFNFEIGEKVKVCDGPFAFTGLIEEIDEENLDLKSQFRYLVGQLL